MWRKNKYLSYWLAYGALVVGYCLTYAPYGINETDGGFISALAWQYLQGKSLYTDIVYVRPPIPIAMRALEMQIIPDHWAVLGERWMFYVKVGVYSLVASAIMADGARKYILAAFAFILSAHCYPAAAWHTVDGIFWSVWAFYLLFKAPSWSGSFASGAALALALFCKQSFYPLLPLYLAALFLARPWKTNAYGMAAALAGLFCGCAAAALCFFSSSEDWTQFTALTTSAASGGEAFSHGVLDYFRIAAPLLALSALLAAYGVFRRAKPRIGSPRLDFALWHTWLLLLAAAYLLAVYKRQDFTLPFAQMRLLFWVSAGWGGALLIRRDYGQALRHFALLGISWCSAVSWGYNLPILFAFPAAYAAGEIGQTLFLRLQQAPGRWFRQISAIAFSALLLVFYYAYGFVYRDGLRSDMTMHLGDIFPRLRGVYSDTSTAALYSDLRRLHERYRAPWKTLPSFPLANYLSDTYPPLPLDWVVAREMGSGKARVADAIERVRPLFFIEKSYEKRFKTDPELTLTREIFEKGEIIEETSHFWVLKINAYQ